MALRTEQCVKTDLVKMNSYGIFFDVDTFSFRLKTMETANENFLCIKQLSKKNLNLFGVPVLIVKDPAHDSLVFLCAMCDRYLNGFCFRHPFIFVKEEIPKTFPYSCYDTIPSFFELKDSTIPNAGRGIFTKISLPAGVAFGPYAGHIFLDPEKGGAKYTYEICFTFGRKYWVNAERISYSNWLRFVNCARFEQEQNMIGLEYMQNIYFYTYKPVSAGTELLVWYGLNYALFLQIPGANKCTAVKAPQKKTTT